MTTELVVARYSEDVSWLTPLGLETNITVYNKGEFLLLPLKAHIYQTPNAGREAHTYLHHIVTHWDSLSDWTVFLQGDPFAHLPQGVKIEDMLTPSADVVVPRLWTGREWNDMGFLEHRGPWLELWRSRKMRRSEWTLRDWFEANIGIDLFTIPALTYTPGACFAVSREVIRRRPRNFYLNLLSYVSDHAHPEEAYYVERAWLYCWSQAALNVRALWP